jgi:hypothetical protein
MADNTPDKIPAEDEQMKLALEEQRLKNKKLSLEIEELNKPSYRKLNTWTSALAVVIALGGVFAQNYVSSIKSESAKLETAKATEKSEAAKKSVDSARVRLGYMRDSLTAAAADYASINKQVDSAHQTLAKLLEVIKSVNFAGASNNAQKETINTLINKTQSELASTVPRVYIQIADESQRSAAQLLQSRLRENGFIVPGIENIASKAVAPSKAEVRYYRDEEKDEALKVVQIMKVTNIVAAINDIPRKLAGVTGVRSRQYEIWFPKP